MASIAFVLATLGVGGVVPHRVASAADRPAVFRGYQHPNPTHPGDGGVDTGTLGIGPSLRDLSKAPLLVAGAVLPGRCREVVGTPNYWSTARARSSAPVEETVALRVTKVFRNRLPNLPEAPFIAVVLQHDTDFFQGGPYTSALRAGDSVVVFLDVLDQFSITPTFFDAREQTFVSAWGSAGVFDWDRHDRVAQQFVTLDAPYRSVRGLVAATRQRKGTRPPTVAVWTAPTVLPASTCVPWGPGPRPV